MRILIITESFYPSMSGVITRLIEGIRYITRAGHEVVILTNEIGIDNFEGVPIVRIRTPKYVLIPNREQRAFKKQLDTVLQQYQPDVVHVVNPLFLGPHAEEILVRTKLPLVVSYHSDLDQVLSRKFNRKKFLQISPWEMVRSWCKVADMNLCTSIMMWKRLKQIEADRLHLLRRGVNTLQFHPRFRNEEMSARLHQGQKNKLLLLFVGNLTADKGLDQLKPFLKRHLDICLAIIGDGPMKNKLKNTFAGLSVVFLGWMNSTALAEAYASADAFIYTSSSETLGLVVLEAMASGLPVLAVDCLANRELISDQKTGFLYHEDDRIAFQEAIQSLKQEEVRKMMGISCRHQAENFSWTVASQQLLDYYHLAVAHRKRQVESERKRNANR